MTLSTRIYANQAKTTISAAIGPGDTTIAVADTSAFPVPSTGQYFLATLFSGATYEIVQVYGISNGQFTGCVRGQENTTPLSWAAGSSIENRATMGTFTSFTRFTDVMASIDTVESLDIPTNSNSDTYISTVTDDGGNPIVAVSRGDDTWRFINHPTTISSGTAPVGVTNSFLPLSGANALLGTLSNGQYIVQFTSGTQKGFPRLITSASTTGVSWTKPLPGVPSAGDTFQIYQSEVSVLTELQNSEINGILFAIVLGD
jgi:hypothetical protein